MEQPTKAQPCHLDVMLMPNGEVYCNGKMLGKFTFFKAFLTAKGWD